MAYDELASTAVSLTPRLDGAAVHFHQPLHDGESDPQPAVRPFERPVDLREHLENVLQHGFRDANAVVLDRNGGLRPLERDGHLDAAPRFGVFGGVVEQIGENLGEPRDVGLHEDGLLRQVQHETLPHLLKHRPACFDRALQDDRQIGPLLAELNRPARDARNVEQVVHQADHLFQLPLHRAARLVHGVLVVAGDSDDFERIADGGQGISELVGERGQEFVLAAVGFLQDVLGPPPLRHVAENHHDAHDLPVLIADGGGAVVDGPLGPASPHQHGVVRQSDDHPVAQDFLHRAFNAGPRLLIDDAKHGVERLAVRLRQLPAGERFGHAVEIGDRAR